MDLQVDKTSYNFQKLTYSKPGIFDAFVDCSYVLTLENSPRHSTMYQQLKQYRPSSTVFIFVDKGYKKHPKPILVEQKPCHDILLSYYTVFRHAHRHNFSNILIFEDDFLLNGRILQQQYISDIQAFYLSQPRTQLFCYSLGSVPYLIKQVNYQYNTIKLIGGGLHSVIYPHQTIAMAVHFIGDLFKKRQFKEIEDIFNYDVDRYNYKFALCCQPFPVTNNFLTSWGESRLFKVFFKIVNMVVDLRTPHTIFENYDRAYLILKATHMLVILIIFVLISYCIQKIHVKVRLLR